MKTATATSLHHLKGGGTVTVYRLTDALEIANRLSIAVKAAETEEETLYLVRPQTLLISERRSLRSLMVYEFDGSDSGRETCFEVVAAIAKSGLPLRHPVSKRKKDDGGGESGAPLMPALQVLKA